MPKAGSLALFTGSLVISLLVMESLLRLVETYIGSAKFSLLRATTEENSSFHYRLPGSPVEKITFDPLLGWRNIAKPLSGGKAETLTADSWRSSRKVPDPRRTHRVVLLGDSFTYGRLVDDNGTIGAYLEGD